MLTYYLRFLRVLIQGPLSKKITVGETTVYRFRIWPTECEYFRTMNGALMVSLVEISEQLNNLTTRFFQTAAKSTPVSPGGTTDRCSGIRK